MKQRFRRTVMAGMAATLFSSPLWAGAPAGTGLSAMTPQDLQGVAVIDASGKEIGRISSVVVSHDQNKPHAVISSGGVMGMGDREIVLSLDELRWSGDRLQARATPGTPLEYMPEQFVEVRPADQPIGEFSAFEPLQDQLYSPEALPRDDPRRSSD